MGADPKRSPKITHVSWGHMEVEGLGSGRDFKLYPGGGRAWDWKETDTHHSPGIQPAHVVEVCYEHCGQLAKPWSCWNAMVYRFTSRKRKEQPNSITSWLKQVNK